MSSLIPELGSSNDWIWSKYSDRNDFGVRLLFSRDSSACHQVLVDLEIEINGMKK